MPLGITEKMLSLTRQYSACQTHPVLGITHSGFLYRSIHYIVTENQLQHILVHAVINNDTYPNLTASFRAHTRQGNLKFFKVRELSGNFIICQGK